MIQLINTHSHLYVDEFLEDREEALARAVEAGVSKLLLPNIDADSIEPMMKLCEAHSSVCYPMMGLHPTEIPEQPDLLLHKMKGLLTQNSNFVAVGEVGLDFYWDSSNAQQQIDVFKEQIEWAVELQLPLMIHARSAHRQLVETLFPYADKLSGGVFHCFGGNESEATELLENFPNFALGIGGIVTFKKSTLPSVLQHVPLNRIVLETDDPYLAPTPYRGKRNEPAFMQLVAQRLAEIYSVTLEEIAHQTNNTTTRIFSQIDKH